MLGYQSCADSDTVCEGTVHASSVAGERLEAVIHRENPKFQLWEWQYFPIQAWMKLVLQDHFIMVIVFHGICSVFHEYLMAFVLKNH